MDLQELADSIIELTKQCERNRILAETHKKYLVHAIAVNGNLQLRMLDDLVELNYKQLDIAMNASCNLTICLENGHKNFTKLNILDIDKLFNGEKL
jgi:hypothetical protein